jgi:pimeloyl-ACP methyl ester carboxylesterase
LERIDSDGEIHHFHLAGKSDGPPLLLLHCAGGNAEIFYGLRPALERDFQVLSCDLWGHGPDAEPVTPGMSGADYARLALAKLRRLLARLRADGRLPAGPLRLLGVSLGGQIGLRLAAHHPEEVERLVACDTWADTIVIQPGRRFESYHREWARTHPDEVGEWIRHWMRTRLDTLPRLLALYDGKPQDPSPYAAIACPTLLVAGEEDEVTPPDQLRRLHEIIPGSAMTILPGLKHLPMVENPDLFLRTVTPFLRG